MCCSSYLDGIDLPQRVQEFFDNVHGQLSPAKVHFLQWPAKMGRARNNGDHAAIIDIFEAV